MGAGAEAHTQAFSPTFTESTSCTKAIAHCASITRLSACVARLSARVARLSASVARLSASTQHHRICMHPQPKQRAPMHKRVRMHRTHLHMCACSLATPRTSQTQTTHCSSSSLPTSILWTSSWKWMRLQARRAARWGHLPGCKGLQVVRSAARRLVHPVCLCKLLLPSSADGRKLGAAHPHRLLAASTLLCCIWVHTSFGRHFGHLSGLKVSFWVHAPMGVIFGVILTFWVSFWVHAHYGCQ